MKRSGYKYNLETFLILLTQKKIHKNSETFTRDRNLKFSNPPAFKRHCCRQD